ncbi:hypothetical protein WNY61_10480 [Sulfitobacter sp. AS92]
MKLRKELMNGSFPTEWRWKHLVASFPLSQRKSYHATEPVEQAR